MLRCPPVLLLVILTDGWGLHLDGTKRTHTAAEQKNMVNFK